MREMLGRRVHNAVFSCGNLTERRDLYFLGGGVEGWEFVWANSISLCHFFAILLDSGTFLEGASFLVSRCLFVLSRWPSSPFWYRDLFLVSRFCILLFSIQSRLLHGISLCVPFWASTSCKLEVKEDLDNVKKIEKSRCRK